MAVISTSHVVLLIFISLLMVVAGSVEPERKVYVVYFGILPEGEFAASTHHSNILQEVGGSVASESLLYSYQRSFNGFVAKLTEDEAKILAEREDVVSVFPNGKKQLHTTRSWDFMGFSKSIKRSNLEGDVIVGMLDTGIWPDSQSFNDSNFGPPPAKWKGKCQKWSNFTCNNKIIGARYYRADGNFISRDVASPIDTEGHGTHTASTAAGGIVQGASMLGFGQGDARGGVPSARLAVYKICWSDGCYDADILAAFDDAIADGVDVISLSVGTRHSKDYFNDSIAIGSFHAMKNGILTSNSAGNSGPAPGSTSSVAPWLLSVAAGTIDRKFVAKVLLGNGKIYELLDQVQSSATIERYQRCLQRKHSRAQLRVVFGVITLVTRLTPLVLKGPSINTFNLKEKMYPFIYAGNAGVNGSDASFCDPLFLDGNKVKGKIVLCDMISDGTVPADKGAEGVVMRNYGFDDVAFSYVLPAVYMSFLNGSAVFDYLNSTTNATATILRTNTETDAFAPSVASSSSRGPNLITFDILKPDITAPGVEILAAWSEATSPTGSSGDKRVVPYNILSGTSMACPHASGTAAYIKSFHPSWSPAAIKSALMTTAYRMNPTDKEDEFSYGAGHINPAKAIKPGLVYDAHEIDYIKFLCGQGYNENSLKLLTGNVTHCSKATNGTVWDLNYPSFTLSAANFLVATTRIFHRTVTNVGSADSTYKAVVSASKGLRITVEPSVLTFKAFGEKKSFIVKASVTITSPSKFVISGSLIWDDGVHKVRSPIVGYLPSALFWP